MRRTSYILLITVVLFLFAGCGDSNTNTEDKYDVSKLYGTWFNEAASDYYVFRDDGMCSWAIGKLGDEFRPYVVDDMDITIGTDNFSNTYVFRIEGDTLYLTDHTLEMKYLRVKGEQ